MSGRWCGALLVGSAPEGLAGGCWRGEEVLRLFGSSRGFAAAREREEPKGRLRASRSATGRGAAALPDSRKGHFHQSPLFTVRAELCKVTIAPLSISC